MIPPRCRNSSALPQLIVAVTPEEIDDVLGARQLVEACAALSTAKHADGRSRLVECLARPQRCITEDDTELSSPRYDLRADPVADDGVGARRASPSSTAGFPLGAGVAGALTQWGPWPAVPPYLARIGISIPLALLVLATPETRPRTNVMTSLRSDLRVPPISHLRFVRTIVPTAPWVFGCAGVAHSVFRDSSPVGSAGCGSPARRRRRWWRSVVA